jgi:hypothetical protein
MQSWDISIPIEGKVPSDLNPIKCSEVLFHVYDDPFLKRKQLFGTIVVEGDRLVVEGKAVVMIDDALTKLHLLHLDIHLDYLKIVQESLTSLSKSSLMAPLKKCPISRLTLHVQHSSAAINSSPV